MNNKSKKYFSYCFKLILIIYIFIYFFYQKNYYERKKSYDVYLNEQNIKQFEDDIKNNKIIDINSYISYEQKDYSNSISRLGEKLNNSFGTVLIKGTSKVFKQIKKLVW